MSLIKSYMGSLHKSPATNFRDFNKIMVLNLTIKLPMVLPLF